MLTVVPPYPWFFFLWFQSPPANRRQEAEDPPSACPHKVSGSLVLHPRACVVHHASCHHVGILSFHITRRRVDAEHEVILRERERAHLHNFITANCCNSSILLLGLANPLLWLIYKLNFIIHMHA